MRKGFRRPWLVLCFFFDVLIRKNRKQPQHGHMPQGQREPSSPHEKRRKQPPTKRKKKKRREAPRIEAENRRELELMLTHMTQKPMLRVEVCARA